MRRILCALLLIIPLAVLSSCSLSNGDDLVERLKASEDKIQKIGVLITGTNSSGDPVLNVHQVNTGFYVNDAVLVGELGEIRQFDRQRVSKARAAETAVNFAYAQVEDLVRFASNEFKVTSRYLEHLQGDKERLNLVLSDQYGNLGIIKISIDYRFANDLLVSVTFPKILVPTGDSADFCFYFPASCLTEIYLDYTPEKIQAAMAKAKERFEKKWLTSAEDVANFNSLLVVGEKTANTSDSWTIINSSRKQGSIYEASRDEGVIWSESSPTERFTSQDILSGALDPELGLLKNTLFDSTDGGSNFFYSGIRIDKNKNSFSIINSDGKVAIEFITSFGMISEIIDYQLGKEHYYLQPEADLQLMDKKLLLVIDNP